MHQIDSLKTELDSIKNNFGDQKESRVQHLFYLLNETEKIDHPQANQLRVDIFENLSDIFTHFGLFEDALFYNQRAIDENKASNNQKQLANLLRQRGKIYLTDNKINDQRPSILDSAQICMSQALSILKDDVEEMDLSPIYICLAEINLGKSDFAKSLHWVKLADLDSRIYKNSQSHLTSKSLLAQINLAEKNYNSAIRVSNDIINDSVTLKYPEIKANAYNNLYNAYNSIGKSSLALSNLEKYIELTNAQTLYPSQVKLAGISDRFKAEQMKNQTLRLQLEASHSRAKAKRARLTNFFLLASLIIFSIFGLTYLIKERYKQQNLKLKLIQNMQKAELDSINAAMDGRDNERRDIGQYLHDHVSALLNSANIHLEVLSYEVNLGDNKILLKTQSILDDVADKIRNLSHRLINDVLQKYGLKFALNDLCTQMTSDKIEFEFHSDIQDGVRYNLLTETKIFSVVQELLNNVLKHSEADRAVLTYNQSTTHIIIEVSDNGIGFSPEDIENGGVGLTQVRSRIKSMGGVIRLKGHDGAVILLRIPLSIANQGKSKSAVPSNA